jgi:hypothetical protein
MELVILLIPFVIAICVACDASKRCKSGWSCFWWFIGTWGLLIVFLPAWLICRPPLPGNVQAVLTSVEPKLCCHCGKYYEREPRFCPNCGHSLAAPVLSPIYSEEMILAAATNGTVRPRTL